MANVIPNGKIRYVGAGTIAVNNTVTTQAIAQPTCQRGDLLLAFIMNKGLANNITAESGWTQVFQSDVDCTTAADDHRVAIFRRFAAASTGNHTFTKATDDNQTFGGYILAYRGVNRTPIDATAVTSTTTVGAADNVSFPAFDPTAENAHIIYAAFYGQDATTFAAAMSSDTNPDCTLRSDQETSTGSDLSIAVTSGDTTDGSNIAARTWASNATTDSGNIGVVFALVPSANLAQGIDSDGNSTATTESFTPAANNLLLATVNSRTDISVHPNIPTLTGNGLTWEQVDTIVYDTSPTTHRRLTLFRAMGASPSADTLDADFGGQNQNNVHIIVDQFKDTSIAGSNGSGAIVQSKTNKDETGSSTNFTVTLDNAFSGVDNATYGVVGTVGGDNLLAGFGFAFQAEIDTVVNINTATEFLADEDLTVNFTTAIATQWGGIAIEIAVPSTTAIKTALGLAKASVKTVNGLAIASVKSMVGLN